MEKIEIGRYKYTGKPLRLGRCKLKTGDIIKVKDFGFGYVSVIVYFDIEFFCYEEGDFDEVAYASLDQYAEHCTAKEVLYANGDEPLTFQERVRRYKILKQLNSVVFPSYQRRKRRIKR